MNESDQQYDDLIVLKSENEKLAKQNIYQELIEMNNKYVDFELAIIT